MLDKDDLVNMPLFEQETYFPIRIQYEGSHSSVIVNDPKDIIGGKEFRVLETGIKL